METGFAGAAYEQRFAVEAVDSINHIVIFAQGERIGTLSIIRLTAHCDIHIGVDVAHTGCNGLNFQLSDGGMCGWELPVHIRVAHSVEIHECDMPYA